MAPTWPEGAELRTDDFDYELPPERIAQTPVEPRDRSRLLVVHRQTGQLEHRIFREIGEYLRPGDLLVANDSRVLPGRLVGRKPTGGRVELLLLRDLGAGWWEALARPASRLRRGQQLELERPAPSPAMSQDAGAPALPVSVELGERTDSGGVRVRFSAPVEQVLAAYGAIPLPPYIHTPLADPERYQTVYSRVTGSAAAPTAGLHFTPQLLDSLAAKGVGLAFVTLHVGPDTFRPVRVKRVVEHKMHSEFAVVPASAAAAIQTARAAGGRVVAIGTTVVRALESWAAAVEGPAGGVAPAGAAVEGPAGGVAPAGAAAGEGGGQQSGSETMSKSPAGLAAGWSGWTRLFIYPGYRFRVVDALITNFHLPRSTLLMLVSAFAGHDLMHRVYREAIARGYRFYSFGDACLFL